MTRRLPAPTIAFFSLLLAPLAFFLWLPTGQARAEGCTDPEHARLAYLYRLLPPSAPRGGEEGLAAVQSVVGLLLADPTTDWSTVSIDRLRRHLVDRDLLMRRAEVVESEIDGGLEVVLAGPAEVLAAGRRAVPEHARALDGFRGWRASVEETPEGLRLSLESDDPQEAEVIRALGFFGFLASGVQPRERHLAIARGVDLPRSRSAVEEP